MVQLSEKNDIQLSSVSIACQLVVSTNYAHVHVGNKLRKRPGCSVSYGALDHTSYQSLQVLFARNTATRSIISKNEKQINN